MSAWFKLTLMILCVLIAEAEAAPQSIYMPMSDGTGLATDIHLPETGQVSTLLVMTRYGRATRFSAGAIAAVNQLGFAVILVDMRGSGASEGTRAALFSAEERADIKTILDWISAQNWSNGKVITTGVSYDANLADFAIVAQHPAVSAVVSRFGDYDLYRHLIAPGGIRNRFLMTEWAKYVYALDRNIDCLLRETACADLNPVMGDIKRLRRALLMHQKNWDPTSVALSYEYSDDLIPSGRRLSDGFLSSHHVALRNSKTPRQIWASWLDAATAETALIRYQLNNTAPVEVYIGAWNHGGNLKADPFLKEDQRAEKDPVIPLQKFGEFISAIQTGHPPDRIIHYYTMGKGWQQSQTWPPRNIISSPFFLGAANQLVPVFTKQESGVDDYQVDYSTTTGTSNRWHTQMGGKAVTYSGWTAMQDKMLAYTSAPLAEPLEITGSPTAYLTLSSDHPDASVYVYLSAVAPSGDVIYITEGQLRLVNSTPTGPQEAFPAPFTELKSFRREDARPWKAGRAKTIKIRLLPTSVLLPKGYRIQLAIAGHDTDTFTRYPSEGNVTLRLFRSSEKPSYIDIPHAGERIIPLIDPPQE